MLESLLLPPRLLLLAVGRLEVVLEAEVSETPRSSRSSVGSSSSSSSLAEADVDVAGQERPQSVLPVLAGEILLEVRRLAVTPGLPVVQSLSQAEPAQSQAGAGLGCSLTSSQAKQEVRAGGLSRPSKPGGGSSPAPGKTKQGVHS